MYRIKIGNMYLANISLDDNKDATFNEFIDYVNIGCRGGKLFRYESVANKIADKLYILLGVKPVVEKVGEEDE